MRDFKQSARKRQFQLYITVLYRENMYIKRIEHKNRLDNMIQINYTLCIET